MTSPLLTLGVEEEFHLVDLVSRRLTPRATEILQRLEHVTTPAGGFAAELQQSVVETNSAVTTSMLELRQHLVALRGQLITTAERLGIGIAAAGTMPLGAPLTMTENPRFRRMLADYQLLVREQMICGMQVHVGIADRDLAVQVMGRLSPWLPLLAGELPLLAPLANVVEAWFGFQCHRDPSRALTLSGVELPVCARCFGIYAGLGAGALVLRPRLAPKFVRLWLAVSVVIMLLDVATELLGMRPASSPLRVMTGALLAWPIGVALVDSADRYARERRQAAYMP